MPWAVAITTGIAAVRQDYELPAHLGPGDVGEPEVEEDQVERRLLHQAERGLAVRRRGDPEAGLREAVAEHPLEIVLVLHDEDLMGHGVSARSRARRAAAQRSGALNWSPGPKSTVRIANWTISTTLDSFMPLTSAEA